jgi:hypothetical protein
MEGPLTVKFEQRLLKKKSITPETDSITFIVNSGQEKRFACYQLNKGASPLIRGFSTRYFEIAERSSAFKLTTEEYSIFVRALLYVRKTDAGTDPCFYLRVVATKEVESCKYSSVSVFLRMASLCCVIRT